MVDDVVKILAWHGGGVARCLDRAVERDAARRARFLPPCMHRAQGADEAAYRLALERRERAALFDQILLCARADEAA